MELLNRIESLNDVVTVAQLIINYNHLIIPAVYSINKYHKCQYTCQLIYQVSEMFDDGTYQWFRIHHAILII